MWVRVLAFSVRIRMNRDSRGQSDNSGLLGIWPIK